MYVLIDINYKSSTFNFINIISMLRRITKPALSVFARVPAVVSLNTSKIVYQFATKPFNFDKLRTTVESEIKHEEENTADVSEYVNYFQN